jgi:ArsR family transcriptional regulator
VTALKAAAEPTRLRILMLLAGGELNVSDLTRILGQSQPRVSRHLKLLSEAQLVERFREGSWVYFHLADSALGALVGRRLVADVAAADATIARDRTRAEALKRERSETAQAYFAAHASEWDRIRSLHVDEAEVEAAMRQALGPGPFPLLLDLGTGTGRILEIFAGRYERGLGIDVNQAMLSYARANLDRARLAQAQVRHGDIYNLGLADGAAGAVVMHQVLHFLVDPGRALAEASRVLAPGGRLLLVDFAPHELEFLRTGFAHVRLGFPRGQVEQWIEDAGLEPLSFRELTSSAGDTDDRLTVSVWLAGRAGADTNKDATHA